MTERPGLRPEQGLLIALIVFGTDLLVALLFLLGVFPVSRWYGVVILAAGALTAGLILFYSRKIRREHRPTWMETQAWRQGLVNKLHEHEDPKSQGGQPGGN